MCHQLDCPGYMSQDCQDAVYKQNPDFGVRVLTAVIQHGNDRDKPKKIREFIKNETTEKLQEIYDNEDVKYICRMLYKKTRVSMETSPMTGYLKEAGLKLRAPGKRKKKK